MALEYFFRSILVILIIVKCLNADDHLNSYKGFIENEHNPIQIIYITQDDGKFNSDYSARITDGISYSELLQKQQYVIDKTLLIHSLMKSIGRVTLITYGRRWGKTTNINMIKEFVEIELDEDYKIKPQKETKAYKFFTQGKLTVKGKEISVHPFLISEKKEICEEYLATHPVIHITLMDLKPDLYDTFFLSFREIISGLFDRYVYIETSLKKSVNDDQTNDAATRRLKTFNTLANGEANISQLQYSVKFLSKLLYEHHGKKVFIFMDEYDTIYNELFLDIDCDLTEKDISSIREFMTIFMTSTFTENPYIDQGIITGISRISKESMFNGSNMVQEFSIFSPEVNLFYGIMKDELDLLFKLYPHMKEQENSINLKYKGYTIQHKNFETYMYNVFSITRCLMLGILDDYWANSGYAGLIETFMYENYFCNQIKYLVLNPEANITISFDTLDFDINTFVAMRHFLDRHKEKKQGINNPYLGKAMLKLVINTAYLSAKKMNNTCYELSIPNEEVNEILYRTVLSLYIELEGLKMDFEFFILVEDPDVRRFEQSMQSYLDTPATIYYNSLKMKYNIDKEVCYVNEEFYHDIITGILMLLHPKRMHVNLEIGDENSGPDAFLIWKNYVIIIEIKYGSRENDFKALNQCKSYRSSVEHLLKIQTSSFRYIVIRCHENKTISIILQDEKHRTD